MSVSTTDRFDGCPEQAQWDEWLAKWKERLGLQAWILSVQAVPAGKLSEAGRWGEANLCHEHRDGVILINRDTEIAGSPAHLGSWEFVLIHELLHCLYDGACFDHAYSNEFSKLLYEQAINATARALWELDRQATVAE